MKYPISKILIEDPHFSLRCERKYLSTIDFSFIEKMYDIAKSKNPHLQVIFNYDLLLHEKDFKICDNFLKFLSKILYDGIRIQDYGLARFISKNYPEMNIEISSFTGNYNWKALSFFEKSFPNFRSYSYPNEVDYETIQFLESKSKTENEIFFHGPLLLFYSKRRLIKESDYAENLITDNEYYQTFLKEKKRPDEFFRFLDNHHGSFLFYPKEISLIEYIDKVIDLGVPYSLIDLRGKSIDFIVQFNQIFFEIVENNLFLEENKTIFEKEIRKIKHLYGDQLMDGFFFKNKTDNNAEKTDVEFTAPNSLLGTVIGVVKEKIMAIQVISEFPLEENQNLFIKTPGNKEITFHLKFIKDIHQNYLIKALEKTIVLINAPKGALPQSLLYKS